MKNSISTYLLISITVLFFSCSSRKGKKLADFNLKTLEGKEISNKDLEGKTVVINVWGTWCGPCVREIGHLNELVEKYQDDDSVIFLALAKEEKAKISKFMNRRNFKYVQIPDAENLTDELHAGIVDEIPLHIIVNNKGIITFEMVGASEDIVQLLSAEIKKVKS